MSGIKKYFVSPNSQNSSENVVVESNSKKKQRIPHNKKNKRDLVKIDKSRNTSNSNEDKSCTKTVFQVDAISGLITDPKNVVGNEGAIQKQIKSSHQVKSKPKILRCLSGDTKVKGELQNENETDTCSQNSGNVKSDINNDFEECYDFNAKTNHRNDMNAFQYMMHARNKSLGTNSPGKQKKETEILKDQNKDVLAKRRIKFEAWADERGGLKRKLTDELIDTQIKQEMNKRAKRLKKLLTRTCDQKNLGLEEVDLENKSLKTSDNQNQNLIKEHSLSPSLQNNVINPKGKLSHTRNALNKIHVIEDDNNIDEEFLSKLNSPIKNNRSLLCYFEKVNVKLNTENNSDQNLKLSSNGNSEIVNNKSPALQKNSTCTSTPKFRQKSGTPSSKWKIRLVNSKYNCDDSDDDNSCVDLCDSVSDTEILSIQSTSKKHKGERFCVSDSSPVETNSSGLDLLKGKKLAPLFEKPAKYVPDHKVKAKEEFLKSGVPEKILVSQRQEILNQPPIFPLISHVQQKNTDSHIWNLSNQILDKKNHTVETCFEFSLQNSSLRIGTFTDCERPASSEYRHNDINTYLPPKHIKTPKDTLISIKHLFPEFPVYKTFRILKQKFDNTSDILATNYITNNLREEIIKIKTQKSSEKIRISKNQNFSSNGGKLCYDEKLLLINTKQILWSDIFCPSSSNEIIGNKIAITSLMNWLVAWKDFSSTKDNLNYDSGSNYDSDADFIDNNEGFGNSTNHKSLKNTALLLGPTGCGKTSAVYALANELGYNVIELNASSKRTGKIVLSKLREATQSHRVRNNDNVYSYNIQVANKLSSVEKKKVKKTYQRYAIPALQRETKLPSENSKPEGPSKVLSLILVEDIDIVFEQDDGFISALFQIVQTSKRPIIFTSNNESNNNVQKFMNCLAIYFKPAKPEVMTTWLQILCLVNNLHISSTSIHQLLDIYKGDLRRTLLQLQYWVLSGGDPNSVTNNNKQNIGSISTTKIITTEQRNQPNSAADERSKFNDDLELHSDEGSYLYSVGDKDCSKSEYSACHKKCIICTCSHENSNACKNLFTLEYLWFHLSAVDLYSRFKMMNVNSKKSNLNAFSQLTEFFDTTSYIDHALAKIQIIRERDEQSYVVDLYTISEFLISYAYSKSEVDPHVYHKSKHDDERFHQDIQSNVNALSSATNEVIRNTLNQYQPLQRPKYSKTFALDYGPALRAICRSEKQRNDVNVKRITSNRFYHYLKTLGVCFTEDMLNFACNSLC